MMEQHSYSADYTNRYKFNGKELDEETGNYYYGARYYNPKFSIWLSVDPLAESFPNWNPYNYTMQNPINLIDPTGMSPEGDPLNPPKDPKNGQTHSEHRDSQTYNYTFVNGAWKGDAPIIDAVLVKYPLESNSETLQKVQFVADIIGSSEIPIVSQIGDIFSAGVDIYNGEYANAMISLAGAVVPGLSQFKTAKNGLNLIDGASDAAKAQKKVFVPKDVDGKTLKTEKSAAGNTKIDKEARGRAHTQLREDKSGNYPQRTTFDANGRKRVDTHHTTHGEPNKTNPHRHIYYKDGRRSKNNPD